MTYALYSYCSKNILKILLCQLFQICTNLTLVVKKCTIINGWQTWCDVLNVPCLNIFEHKGYLKTMAKGKTIIETMLTKILYVLKHNAQVLRATCKVCVCVSNPDTTGFHCMEKCSNNFFLKFPF